MAGSNAVHGRWRNSLAVPETPSEPVLWFSLFSQDVYSFGVLLHEIITGERPQVSLLRQAKAVARWHPGVAAPRSLPRITGTRR